MANIDGTLGNDLLESLPGDDVIDGMAGNDTVSYADAAGAVTVSLKLLGQDQNTGGAGIDTLISIERLIGSTFHDHLIGNFGTNFLYGGEGNDWLVGGAGSDRLYGEAGNDLLDGGTGADFMRGGEGNDTYYVDNADDVVQEWWYGGNGGIDTVRARASFTLPQHVENLTLAGSASIDGTGNAANNTLTGNSGDNALYGGDGDDVIEGGAGADLIDGGNGFDMVSYVDGDAGVNDLWLSSYAEDDQGNTLISIEGFIGSQYRDWVIGDREGYFRLFGEGGDDELELGSAGLGEAHGGIGNDILWAGGGGDSFLYGEEGNDYLIGNYGTAIAYMRGGVGNDFYAIGYAGDFVIEEAGEGVDAVLIRSSSSYSLPDNVENIEFDYPLASYFNLAGNDLANEISVRYLQNGILDLHGGGGDDIFGFDEFDGQAIIDDFTSGEDIIRMPYSPTGFVFNGSAGQSGTGDQAWTTQSGTTTTVHVWQAGAVQFTIDLLGVTAPLTSSDFIL